MLFLDYNIIKGIYGIYFYTAISSFFIAFLITFYLVPLICRLAIKLQLIDIPDGQ